MSCPLIRVASSCATSSVRRPHQRYPPFVVHSVQCEQGVFADSFSWPSGAFLRRILQPAGLRSEPNSLVAVANEPLRPPHADASCNHNVRYLEFCGWSLIPLFPLAEGQQLKLIHGDRRFADGHLAIYNHTRTNFIRNCVTHRECQSISVSPADDPTLG